LGLHQALVYGRVGLKASEGRLWFDLTYFLRDWCSCLAAFLAHLGI
jgi:hypothetical protein